MYIWKTSSICKIWLYGNGTTYLKYNRPKGAFSLGIFWRHSPNLRACDEAGRSKLFYKTVIVALCNVQDFKYIYFPIYPLIQKFTAYEFRLLFYDWLNFIYTECYEKSQRHNITLPNLWRTKTVHRMKTDSLDDDIYLDWQIDAHNWDQADHGHDTSWVQRHSFRVMRPRLIV